MDLDRIERRGLPAIVFDGDDTLWQTEPLYDEARANAATYVGSLGINPGEFEETQRKLDLQRAGLLGVSRARFPGSSVEAAKTLATEHSVHLNRKQLRHVQSLSSEVFQKRAPLEVDALRIISNLRVTFQIALLTKGDEQVQRKRLADSGLAPLLDFAHIVDKKDAESFGYVLARMQASPSESWSVGNSFDSDIAPALEIRMKAIWIEAEVWDHERPSKQGNYEGKFVRARQLADVPGIVGQARNAD